MPKFTCPHCDRESEVGLTAALAPESRVSMTWHPKPGEMMSAAAIGGCLTDFAKLMSAIAREHGGSTTTYLEQIATQDDGSIRADFVVLMNKKKGAD